MGRPHPVGPPSATPRPSPSLPPPKPASPSGSVATQAPTTPGPTRSCPSHTRPCRTLPFSQFQYGRTAWARWRPQGVQPCCAHIPASPTAWLAPTCPATSHALADTPPVAEAQAGRPGCQPFPRAPGAWSCPVCTPPPGLSSCWTARLAPQPGTGPALGPPPPPPSPPAAPAWRQSTPSARHWSRGRLQHTWEGEGRLLWTITPACIPCGER